MGKRIFAEIGKDCCFCGVCRVVCPWQAVEFSPETGYAVNPEKCAGCGRCMDRCRSRAITIREG